ncbi:hypothetical protein ACFVT6_19505 [Streptomyces sp. NPDC058049]|uniref:hypothetical protein n=1 Tax=Streptomyces sp. NPDC058049 TaxID=3346314 RepID=UPI0036E67CF2
MINQREFHTSCSTPSSPDLFLSRGAGALRLPRRPGRRVAIEDQAAGPPAGPPRPWRSGVAWGSAYGSLGDWGFFLCGLLLPLVLLGRHAALAARRGASLIALSALPAGLGAILALASVGHSALEDRGVEISCLVLKVTEHTETESSMDAEGHWTSTPRTSYDHRRSAPRAARSTWTPPRGSRRRASPWRWCTTRRARSRRGLPGTSTAGVCAPRPFRHTRPRLL